MNYYEINDPKTEEIMEASVEDSDEDVQRMHKEGMEVVMYVKDEEIHEENHEDEDEEALSWL